MAIHSFFYCQRYDNQRKRTSESDNDNQALKVILAGTKMIE